MEDFIGLIEKLFVFKVFEICFMLDDFSFESMSFWLDKKFIIDIVSFLL